MNFPRYIFSGLDCIDFKLGADQDLGIHFDGKAFLLSHENGTDDSLTIDCLNDEQTITTLSEKNRTFHYENEDGFGFWILADGKTVQIGGGGLMVMGTNVISVCNS